MPVVPSLISGTGALFGGCGLGAAIEVMEQVTGRPCIWATAQFLSYALPPAVLELEVTEAVRGHQISQARVIARVGDSEILTVVGALGTRPNPLAGQWATRPDVPPPADCPPRPLMNRHAGHDHGPPRVEARRRASRTGSSPASPGSGNASLWVRLPELTDASAAALAIIGDFVPFGIGQALGQRAGGNSLDNTLRDRAPRPDRVGARRRPRARGRRRLRPRPRALVGGERHVARHREPVDDRAGARPRRARAAPTSSPLTELEGSLEPDR